ncbi:hypothetical protein QOT17_020784 [Balamuthia mandrillaris]
MSHQEGKKSLFFKSPPHMANKPYHAADILAGLLAYNPEQDGNSEPFLQQLENNFKITASNWVQNDIVIPCLLWHQARDVYITHFNNAELQTYFHEDFFKLTHCPKEPVRKVIKRIENILQQIIKQPSEAQKIAMLKFCCNHCLLESISNILLL